MADCGSLRLPDQLAASMLSMQWRFGRNGIAFAVVRMSSVEKRVVDGLQLKKLRDGDRCAGDLSVIGFSPPARLFVRWEAL